MRLGDMTPREVQETASVGPKENREAPGGDGILGGNMSDLGRGVRFEGSGRPGVEQLGVGF